MKLPFIVGENVTVAGNLQGDLAVIQNAKQNNLPTNPQNPKI